ncbi:hypothetical protein J7Y46_004759 [Vibrio parahaemolyticus]|nr:hypothetical protein [Vibrio parahaemolyticus]EHK2924860.1 hypothetical protein [Vibrio parahaemolyticus]EJL6404661.1 hypothetical protein [Vibrio parahaemolyticus]
MPPIIDTALVRRHLQAQFAQFQTPCPNVSHLLPDIKHVIIETVLIHTRGNQSHAAQILGINRATLRRLYVQSSTRPTEPPSSPTDTRR